MPSIDVSANILGKAGVRLTASWLAIAAMGVAAPAWATDPAPAWPGEVPAPQQEAASSGDQAGEQDIVITARRRALEAADARKKASESIISSVVADEAGKLPDNSITEVLQRVSGVTSPQISPRPPLALKISRPLSREATPDRPRT